MDGSTQKGLLQDPEEDSFEMKYDCNIAVFCSYEVCFVSSSSTDSSKNRTGRQV